MLCAFQKNRGCSFFLAWEQATLAGQDTADFEMGARSMRVRFELLPDIEQCELRKWTLNAEADCAAETQVLVGLKRAKAVRQVEAMLYREGKANSSADMERFFKRGGLGKMSAKSVGIMVKIAERFEAIPEAGLIIADLDSAFLTAHVLASHSNLDLVCQKTAVKKDPALQASLLRGSEFILCHSPNFLS